MTPAIRLLRTAHIIHRVHEYDHDPATESYGLEASAKLGVEAERVFKTLVVVLDNQALAVGVVPVLSMLSMKRLAKAAGAKKAKLADQSDVERSTGYVLGGVSPLGQKKQLGTFIDSSALGHSSIYVSAGRRGVELELSPADLAEMVKGVFAGIRQ